LRALDTNVLARWVLGDDPVQAKLAEAALREPCYVSLSVMVELGWVLGKSLNLPRATVAAMLDRVLRLDTVTAEESARLDWALERYRAGADWADAVHLVATARKAQLFITFDATLARKLGKSSPIPVDLLGR
jgi:predicted nucleic-acid-binding protein